MALEFINTFIGGIDKDVSKTLLGQSKYRHAENWRIITDKGAGSGSLENIKGTKLFFTFPTTSPVLSFRVDITGAPGFHGSSDQIQIIINGTPYTLFPGLTGETTDTTVYRDILVTRMNAATSLDISGNTVPNPLKAFNIVAVSSGTDTILVYSTGTTVTTLSTTSTGHQVSGSASTIVTPQSNLEITGWTIIRDDFIILTCSKDNPITGGPGQIWRLTYEPESIGSNYIATLTLLYNNNVNFTVEHPVPSPGSIVGRYENSRIQRIYWTDDFNQLRTFNTANTNGFGINVDLLNVLPSTGFSLPIFTGVTSGGALPVGIYQYSYSLATQGGQETLFSHLSNMIPVNASLESMPDPRTYLGSSSGTATGKQNNLIIKDLDTDFGTIKIVSIFRKNDIDIPEIRIIIEEPIPNDGIFTFSHTGNETGAIVLTLDEFSILNSAFTHCRTIEQKDNVLFAGNVRNRRLNLDYDARAFRFSNTLQGPNTPTGYNVGTLPDIQNDVNPDQRTFRFQADGTTIGGTGFNNPNNGNLPNVSYQIMAAGMPSLGSAPIHLQDSTYQFSIDLVSGTYAVPHRWPDSGSKNINLGITNQDYNLQYFFENYTSPAYHGLFKGYMRTEIYRFALQFYGLDGTPDFVKWIGDIRMATETSGGSFPISTVSGSNLYTHPTFLKFTINIPSSIRSQISGFSIVRVERKQGDKTVLSQGILGGTGGIVGSVLQLDGATALPRHPCSAESLANFTSGGDLYVRGFFPDYQFENNLDYRSGDRIEINEWMETSDSRGYAPIGGDLSLQDIVTLKQYGSSNPTNFATADVIFGTGVAQGAINHPIDNGLSFLNRVTSGSEIIRGQKCFLMHLNNIRNTSGNFADPSLLSGVRRSFLTNYIRDSSTQYGGNTIGQKATNSYISCGHFQPINQLSSSALSFTFDVYGGDIFVPVWDFQERLKNSSVDTVAAHTNFSHVNYFIPVETTLDIDMRLGSSVNRTNITNFGGNLDETLTVPKHYNIENDIRKYLPKPVNFNVLEEFDNRIHASQIKINGEETDQWTRFLSANFIDVEGSYGPINSLVKLKDSILYFQDRAFGSLSINPKVVLQDQTGAQLQLGTGSILEDFNYISTEAGSKSKWGIIAALDSLLFFNVYNKKIYNYSGGAARPLSDIKGIQSFLQANIKGDMLTEDNPIIGRGLTTTYDYRFNEAIFTFRDTVSGVTGIYQSLNAFYSLIKGLPEGIVKELNIGSTITLESGVSVVIVSKEDIDTIKIAAGLPLLQNGDIVTIVGTFVNTFTIAYNVYSPAFISFYGFRPPVYLNDKRVILSPDTNNKKTIHIHNEGNYCSFYGTVFPSIIKMLINPESAITKVFRNFQFHTEVEDLAGVNIRSESANELRVTTDYQDSGVQILTVGSNLKRKERSWNMAVPRNKNKERMRDKYMLTELKFSNILNRRIVMHFFKTSYNLSRR